MDISQYIGPSIYNSPYDYNQIHWTNEEIQALRYFLASGYDARMAVYDFLVGAGMDDDLYEYNDDKVIDLIMEYFLPPSYQEPETPSLTESILMEAQIPAELPGKVLNYVNHTHGARAIDIARAIGYGDQWRLVAAAVKQLAQSGKVNIVSHPNLGLFVFPEGMEAKLPGGKQIAGKTQELKSETTPKQPQSDKITSPQIGEFKNPKDAELAHKILGVLKRHEGMSQLDICKAIGFPGYDMRTTMVIRELTIRQHLLVNRTAKPMTFSINPNYDPNKTTRLAVSTSPKAPSVRSKKAKMELANTIKNDLERYRPPGGGDEGDPAEIRQWGDKISIVKDWRYVGRWDHDEENAWDHEDDSWREDDDQMIWTDHKRYYIAFNEWVKQKSWAKMIKKAYIETSEKCWATWTIELK